MKQKLWDNRIIHGLTWLEILIVCLVCIFLFKVAVLTMLAVGMALGFMISTIIYFTPPEEEDDC
jgi:hypothetical protein